MSERWNGGVTRGELRRAGLSDHAAEFTLREEFEAYDSLPAKIRRFLNEESRFKATALDVRDHLRAHPRADVDELLRIMRENEARAAEALDVTRSRDA